MEGSGRLRLFKVGGVGKNLTRMYRRLGCKQPMIKRRLG